MDGGMWARGVQRQTSTNLTAFTRDWHLDLPGCTRYFLSHRPLFKFLALTTLWWPRLCLLIHALPAVHLPNSGQNHSCDCTPRVTSSRSCDLMSPATLSPASVFYGRSSRSYAGLSFVSSLKDSSLRIVLQPALCFTVTVLRRSALVTHNLHRLLGFGPCLIATAVCFAAVFSAVVNPQTW